MSSLGNVGGTGTAGGERVSIPVADTAATTTSTGGEDETVPSNILRRSVLQMEKDWAQRRKAIMLFVGLTAALTFLTPLYVIRGLGLVPTFPDVSGLKTSITAYYTYCRKINTNLASQIYGNYSLALSNQTADCSNRTDAAYKEIRRVPLNSSAFANRYCDHVLERLYANSLVAAASKFTTDGTCSYSSSGQSATLGSNYFVWEIQKSSSSYKYPYNTSGTAYTISTPTTDGTTGNFLFGVLMVTPTPFAANCTGEVWDVVYFNGGTINSWTCIRFKTFMQNNVTANNVTSTSYVTSAKNYINYNLQQAYQVGVVFAGILGNAASDLGNTYTNLRNTANNYNTQLQTGVADAKSGYSSFQSVYQTVGSVTNQLSITNLHLDPPSISIPPIPASIEKLNTYRSQLLSYQNILSNYNPPPVNWPSTDISYNYSVPNVTLVVPSITLKDSILVTEIYAAFNALQSVLEYFLAYDIALRVCLWLQDIAFLFMEPRRNFIRTTTKCKNVMALLFKHLSLFLYLGVFLAIVIVAATFAYDPNTVVEELQTLCHNQVLVQNDATLTGYKNALEGRKVTCNNTLLTLNAQMQNNDKVYINMLRQYAGDYESFYNATAPTPSGSAVGGRIAQNITLSAASYPAYSNQAQYQYYFSFQDYAIDQNLCTSTAEAQAVSTAISYNVKLLGQYVVSLLMIGLGTVICLKFLIWGLQRWYWLELTKGYIMEMEITSAMVKKRVRMYKIQAIGMFMFSAVLFIVDLAVYSSAIKNVKV
eukprot:TRINITY_DN13757_c0_g1_i1.p1 TRINITY_DN13757_c0_g1~~TRINITY_DN13757_c0_g1_i1.p1  ORF type:complete len:763 (-),score=153.54 TRINITY_DN13757_c0_g1_i1:77-2365(-)